MSNSDDELSNWDNTKLAKLACGLRDMVLELGRNI
jgi:hypothetical protein